MHVDKHDDAYAWAKRCRLRIDRATRSVDVVAMPIIESRVVEESTQEVGRKRSPATPLRLFDHVGDDELGKVGVGADILPLVRAIETEGDLDTADWLSSYVRDALVCLAAGYSVQEIPSLIGVSGPPLETTDIKVALETDESQQKFWFASDQDELARVLDAPLEAWRIYLHPDQRRLVEREFKGPALVRGGAGTGKTVVAMHRARWLAAALCRAPNDRILFTTFTSNLAADIRKNLEKLCPEFVKPGHSVIEVKNLDQWVGEFLRGQGYERKIAYFGASRKQIDDIWDEVSVERGLPAGVMLMFLKDEWAQVVQAQGIADRKAYLFASRSGRGTALDRKKRSEIWDFFEVYRSRLQEEKLSEPDDAYRDAGAILAAKPGLLPYKAVVVDEGQDMGGEAFRLIRAIVPAGENDANKIFIVGDAHQRIYNRRASLKECGISVVGRSSNLRLNYRTTNEIRRWAVAILEGVHYDDLDDGVDNLKGYRSVYHGPAPKVRGYDRFENEMAGLISFIREKAPSELDQAKIAVLAKTNHLIDDVAAALKAAGLSTVTLKPGQADDGTAPGVRLATMHRAKGLEFETVAIVCLNDGVVPFRHEVDGAIDAAAKRNVDERERSLVHVAATRAKRYLMVSWSGKKTSLLSGS
jgi:superfamily I DNA/RNA helicase